MSCEYEKGDAVVVLAGDGDVTRGTEGRVSRVCNDGTLLLNVRGRRGLASVRPEQVELVGRRPRGADGAPETGQAPEVAPEPPEQPAEPPEPPKSRFAAGVRRKRLRATAEDVPVVAVDARGEVVELPEPDEHAKDHAIRVPEAEPTRSERWAGLTERERRWLCRMPPEWEPDTLEQVVMDAMAQGMPAEGAQALVAELVGRIRAIVREEAA